MFGKVIVFGLFEMIQKKKKRRVRTASLGSRFGLRVGLGMVTQAVTLFVVSKPRFR